MYSDSKSNYLLTSWKLFFKPCETLKNVTNFLSSLNTHHSVNWGWKPSGKPAWDYFCFLYECSVRMFFGLGSWGVFFHLFCSLFLSFCDHSSSDVSATRFSHSKWNVFCANFLWTSAPCRVFPAMPCKLRVQSHQNREREKYWGFLNCSIWKNF